MSPAPEPATALLQPAEVTRELSDFGPATTLLSLVGEAMVRGLGDPGPVNVLSPPAANLLRAEAAPFIKAGSSLKPTGSKVTAHSQTATNASLLPDGVVCGALGAPPGACDYFFSPGGCNRGPECWFSLVKPESRRAEARIVPEKETAGNSRKGSLYQEPAEYNKS